MFKILYIVILIACSSLSTTVKGQPNGSTAEARPNIIVVLVDDMRWDDYGNGGHSFIKTPNIDRLELEGASFKNAFATTPLCSPSRASILTGQYAHTHGIIDNTDRSEQSHQLKTFPAKLDDIGYETAFIGKWHMGNDNTPRPGFNYWVALKGQGEVHDPVLNVNGKQTKAAGYVTDILTDLSIEFINRPRSQPFLLYLSEKALHPNLLQRDDGSIANIGEGGFIPAERHNGIYKDQVFNRRLNACIPPLDKPALARKIGNLPPLGHETATPEDVIRDRSEMLMAIDDGIGRIIKALEVINVLNNTIIVFTSDHGYWYGEHGLNEERRLAYEEALRIPLIIRYPPKIKAGIKPVQIALNIDLAPTLLEFAGYNAETGAEGRSLIPILNEQSEEWRSSFLIEYYSDKVWPRMVQMGYKAIRTKQYKYIKYTDLNDMDELYNLEEDPYELNNIINQPNIKPILQELELELKSFLAQSARD